MNDVESETAAASPNVGIGEVGLLPVIRSEGGSMVPDEEISGGSIVSVERLAGAGNTRPVSLAIVRHPPQFEALRAVLGVAVLGDVGAGLVQCCAHQTELVF